MAVEQGPRAPVPVVLWGAGGIFRKLRTTLLDLQAMGQFDIRAVVDANPPAACIEGIPVVRPCDVRAAGTEYLFILNKRDAAEIAHQAVGDCGFSQDRLLPYAPLLMRGFNMARYLRLRACAPSIVSNSSWGVSAFGFLGLEPRSPFVGTFFQEADFLRMLEHFEDYLAVDELEFAGTRVDGYGRSYIAARIGDVPIRFLEPHTEETAARLWREGRSQLHAGAVIAQMHTLDPAIERRFDALAGFARKLCFVPYPTDVPSSLHLPLANGYNVYTFSVESMFANEDALAAHDVIGMLSRSDDGA